MMDVMTSGTRPRCLGPQDLLRAFRITLRSAKETPSGSVSVAFISDIAMRRLNTRWRKKRRTTDVLSFAPPKLPSVPATHRHWGDIFISPTFVRKEAIQKHIPFREELLRVAIHGMLHLLGYDHMTVKEEKHMFSLQERSLTRAQNTV